MGAAVLSLLLLPATEAAVKEEEEGEGEGAEAGGTAARLLEPS